MGNSFTFDELIKEGERRLSNGEDLDEVVSDICGDLGTKNLLLIAADNLDLNLAAGDASCDDMDIECPADEIEARLRFVVRERLQKNDSGA